MEYTVEKARVYVSENENKVIETYRQKAHLQPPIGWMNDPNGFLTIAGEQHVFYQYYPYDSVWGPMHWGHAKTKNGREWIHLPVALAPDEAYDQKGCFSGTAMLTKETLTLMYTGGCCIDGEEVQQQCLAVSDDFINFSKLDANPVINKQTIPKTISINDFRDPKIVEHNHKYYAFVVTKNSDDFGELVLFESINKKEWTYKSSVFSGTKEFGEMWECPDIFHLNGKDILILSVINMNSIGEKFKNLSSCLYFIGGMDWEKGTYTYEYYDELDAGLDFYAPQVTLNNENKHLMIAWMQMWDRTIPTHELGHRWAGSMTVMRKLELVNNQLLQTPYLPTKSLVTQRKVRDTCEISLDSQALRIKIWFKELAGFTFRLCNQFSEEVALSQDGDSFTLSRKKVHYSIQGKEADYQEERVWKQEKPFVENIVECIIDTSSIEVFIGGGQKTMSMRFFSEFPLDLLSLTLEDESMESEIQIFHVL